MLFEARLFGVEGLVLFLAAAEAEVLPPDADPGVLPLRLCGGKFFPFIPLPPLVVRLGTALPWPFVRVRCRLVLLLILGFASLNPPLLLILLARLVLLAKLSLLCQLALLLSLL